MKAGLRFKAPNPHAKGGPVSEYEVLRLEGKMCVCYDLHTRQILAMPSKYVKEKLGNTNKKEKL